jgi:lipopolysaccharide/colanic/teichoic acid biosynthesis glycosyltransferase
MSSPPSITSWLPTDARPRQLLRSRCVERLVDIVVAGALLVPALPVLAIIAVAVRLDSSGPVLHRAIRAGRYGRQFTLYKVRTMVTGAAALGPAITSATDARVTRVGRFLRRTKLDELPQLWNVLVGDMRLVGPRPEDPRFVALYGSEQRLVLTVCPGITGPSQLMFFDEERLLTGSDPEEAYIRDVLPRKLALDLAYVRNHDLLGDVQIAAATSVLALRHVARMALGPQPRG